MVQDIEFLIELLSCNIYYLRQYKMLVVKIMHSVPRNKTNQNLKAEKEPECALLRNSSSQ